MTNDFKLKGKITVAMQSYVLDGVWIPDVYGMITDFKEQLNSHLKISNEVIMTLKTKIEYCDFPIDNKYELDKSKRISVNYIEYPDLAYHRLNSRSMTKTFIHKLNLELRNFKNQIIIQEFIFDIV
jgi:hypothetical protein